MTEASLPLGNGSLHLSRGILHARTDGEEQRTLVASILEVTVLRHATSARLTVQPESGILQTYDVQDVGPRLDQFVSSLKEARPALGVYVGSDDEMSVDFAGGRLTLTGDLVLARNHDHEPEQLPLDEIVESIVWDLLGETMGLMLVLYGGEVTRPWYEWHAPSSPYIRRYPDCRPAHTLYRFVATLKARNPQILMAARAVRT